MRRKRELYTATGQPASNFNQLVLGWLRGELLLREHSPPAAFNGVRDAYDRAIGVATETGCSVAEAHREALSQLTELFYGHDLAAELKERLRHGLVNPTGFRTTLSQGVAKNVGENFVNVIVYALVVLLRDQDRVLVDKGVPPQVRRTLELRRTVRLKTGSRELRIPIEADCCIFDRMDPLNAIIISSKTRLKEVFHIGTMWKILFDMIGDQYCLDKWGLRTSPGASTERMLYAFATADMVPEGGERTQGPDVERDEPRNLIAMDASFFDYVFVSKMGIPHVENRINLKGPRGALFHELGCLLDLVSQKFSLRLG